MNDSWLLDEMLDDPKFFDFPMEDLEPNAMEEDWAAQFKRLNEPCFDAFSVVAPLGHCGETQNEKPQLGKGFPASVSILLSIIVVNWNL